MTCTDGKAHRLVHKKDLNFVVRVYCKVCGYKPWKKEVYSERS